VTGITPALDETGCVPPQPGPLAQSARKLTSAPNKAGFRRRQRRTTSARNARFGPRGGLRRQPQRRRRPGDDALPADVADLVERLRQGEFFDGWGRDEDLVRSTWWGDEACVAEIDDLFARAGRAFLAGELGPLSPAVREPELG
jgi:hypothetical protein